MASDNFTDANGTALTDHDANWTAISGYGDITKLTINNNALRIASWGLAQAYYGASTVDTSQITVLANLPETVFAGPSVRADGANRGYRARFSTLATGNWTVINVVKDNAWFADLSVSIAQNTSHTFKITATGTTTVTVEVFVDDVSQGTETDSTSPIGSGHPGIFLYDDSGTNPTYVDDWTDGAEPAPTSKIGLLGQKIGKISSHILIY